MSVKSSSTSHKHTSRPSTSSRRTATHTRKGHSLSPAVISFLTHRSTFLQAMPLGAAAVVV